MKYNYMTQYFEELPKTMADAIKDAKLMLEENEELWQLSDKLYDAELKLLKFFENQPAGLGLFRSYKECFEKHAGECCSEMYAQGLLDHQRLLVRHQLVASEILKYIEKQGEN